MKLDHEFLKAGQVIDISVAGSFGEVALDAQTLFELPQQFEKITGHHAPHPQHQQFKAAPRVKARPFSGNIPEATTETTCSRLATLCAVNSIRSRGKSLLVSKSL